MNNMDRMLAILNGKKPDRIPFMPFTELIPRGEFEREMRDRGMGLISSCTSLWSEMPNVSFTIKSVNGEKITTYHTPKGDVSTVHRTHYQGISNDSSVQKEFMIKDIKDYEPAIFMIDDTIFHVNEAIFRKTEMDLGGDGFTHVWTDEPPYMDAQYFLGLERWSFEQHDHPEEFQMLLDALERRQERRMRLLLDCPEKYLINLGNLAGNFGPKQFTEHALPYFKKYNSLLKKCGKICTIHADALNLYEYKDIIKESGIDVIEAFTPPPVGNLSLADARKAWGEGVTIWINFPETVFYEGYKDTKKYAIYLLKSDPCHNKFIGLTEMGLLGTNESNEELFKNGIRAIMDAIDEAGIY